MFGLGGSQHTDSADGERRDDPDQDVGQRLRRLWHERGDFSALTADSINNPQQNDDHDETEQVDDRPSAQDMRELSSNLLEQLTYVDSWPAAQTLSPT